MSFAIPRAALYARYSSDNQRNESIDAQLRAMNAYCKQHHWQIVAEYTDEARSATTDNRPQFQKMIVDSSKNLFDIVLVHKLDRFSRDRYDSAIYKKRLKNNNVRLCSVLERIDDTPESIMMESVLEGMAEYYSKNLSREVMKGMNETALQCKHTGGSTPLGYDLDENRKLVINEHESEAVKIIFNMFAEGCGYCKIIDYLTSHGYTSKRNRPFTKNALYSILNNEKYAGVYVFNKAAAKRDSLRTNYNYKTNDKIIRVENGCPAIITRKLFDQVQRIKARNRRNTGRYHSKEYYLLTGIVFCPICGRRMIGDVRCCGKRKNRLATYRCPSLKHTCKNKEINKWYLDAYIVELLCTKIFNAVSLKALINKINKRIIAYNANYDKEYSNVKEEYDQISNALINITNSIERGIINDVIIKRAEELDEKRMQLQNDLNSMHKYSPLKYNEYSNVISDYKSTERNTEAFRCLLQSYIERITVFPYHVEIVLKTGLGFFDDLNETVTIRRGELYEKFNSRVKEEVTCSNQVKSDILQEA